jgi:hypothetical protein
MRKRAAILLAVVLALLARPLQLPAASCILSNAPSPEACKMDCCANKTCCAVSKKNVAPTSQPLSQDGASKQQVIGFVLVPAIDSQVLASKAAPARASLPARAHSPPPLAANCIRLI